MRQAPRWLLSAMFVPAFLWLMFTFFVPIIQLLVTSFQHLRYGEAKWVGLANYEYVLGRDDLFWKALANNATLLLGIPILVALAVLFAVLLYENMHWRRASNFYRSLIFLPYVVPIVVVAQVFSVLLRSDGPVNSALSMVGLNVLALQWLSNPNLVMFSILWAIIWRSVGLGVLFCLARLQTMNPALYDLAQIEGASWWQTLRHVVLPELKSTIVFYVIFLIIMMFSWVFNFVFVMTRGGPAFASIVLELDIFDLVMGRQQPNIGAATAALLLIVVGGLMCLQYAARKRFIEGSAAR